MVRYLQRKGKRETENVIETERGGERMVEKDRESQKLVEMFRTTFNVNTVLQKITKNQDLHSVSH